jgi:ankyrin repeat protein
MKHSKFQDAILWKDKMGCTPLIIASQKGSLQLLKILVSLQCNINERDKKGRTPLHYAVMNGFKECTEYLIQQLANVEMRDSDGKTIFLIGTFQKLYLFRKDTL